MDSLTTSVMHRDQGMDCLFVCLFKGLGVGSYILRIVFSTGTFSLESSWCNRPG